MQQPPVIRAERLFKRYDRIDAVNGIDFQIHQGECFGFLGPNGAGKTSTMKMISCVSPVSSGTLSVFDMDVRKRQRDVKQLLGVVSQADSLDPDLNVMQNLISFGRFFNLPSHVSRERALEGLELFQLADRANDMPNHLSGGMRRRLLIARALMNEPRILVLDEPTTGLDPQARLLVWDKLNLLKSRGITMLLTTHYMDEAEHLCDRLVVIDRGEILEEGTPNEMIQSLVGDVVFEVRVSHSDKPELITWLNGSDIQGHIEDRADSVLIYPRNGSLSLDGIPLDGYQITRRPGNLEDVFLRLTGRGLREE
jgi:lipooligosaccharide transport system ATP-binding protein